MREDWSIYEVSDADEPGDALLIGMRHRDFDGVELLLLPDDDGWMADESNNTARPLLLFYSGGAPDPGDARAMLGNRGHEALCGLLPPLPSALVDFNEGSESSRTIAVCLSYPPYPWLEEARLGMEMGRYFDRAEVTDWTEPTEDCPGYYTFRFFRSDRIAEDEDLVISADDLPF
ncbi:hypothetical protein [Alicyclobacillus sp. ALC3]|uniref:hypothetical protein n=1 Tax=Alicyclobacillus sp. ALC3 TaxID=2796143 RepID=UPI0023799031|nr:hypothetical protein [Alicyclobacillus sp. ALC3]WDL99198.1 hypothetical protein JC200_11455 [Alicyclobacillus sp. ALC3]